MNNVLTFLLLAGAAAELNMTMGTPSLRGAPATRATSTGGFCSYPMWTIPGVGTDSRCDQADCPKRIDGRASPDCDETFGGGSAVDALWTIPGVGTDSRCDQRQ